MKKRPASRMKASHRLLFKAISALSQRKHCSSWCEGVEFEVWKVLQCTEVNDFDSELLEEALWLSQKSGGWIAWLENASEAQFFPLPDWLSLYEAHQKARTQK